MDTPLLSHDSQPSEPAGQMKLGTAWAVASGLMAAWVAAGSTGILAQPLQIVFTGLALGVSVFLARPRLGMIPGLWVATTIAVLFCCQATSLVLSAVVLSVLTLLVAGKAGVERRALWLAAVSSLVLLLFQLARFSVPSVWWISHVFGSVMGTWAAWTSGCALTIGSTFAGFDIVLVMGVFWFGWLMAIRRPRFVVGCCALAAIVIGHGFYLLVLAHAPELSGFLPESPEPILSDPYVPPPFSWPATVRSMLPWNLPFLAAAIQLPIVVMMLRWANWKPSATAPMGWGIARAGTNRWLAGAKLVAPLLLALFLPMFAMLQLARTDLNQKRILVHQDEPFDGRIPTHGRYGQASAGQFGMLPFLIQSLGGTCDFSSGLSSAELNSADLLILPHPFLEMTAAQSKRVLEYVHTGGAVLLVGVGYQPGDAVAFEALLRPAAMSLNQDGALPAIEPWQDATWRSGPAITSSTQILDASLLSGTGASVRLAWPARPVLVARWAWSAAEAEIAWDRRRQLRRGEQLGDLVLAGEQSVGDGRLVLLGDSYCLTNEGLVSGYAFTGRILSYLANRQSLPQVAWRQGLVLLSAASLLVWMAFVSDPKLLAVVPACLALGLLITQFTTAWATRVVPRERLLVERSSDGPIQQVAYIDHSHLEAFSREPWSFDGINGLALNLMRNGFLPLAMPRLTAERLQHASLMISIAPARSFSARERRELRAFVQRGGIVILTVGAEQAAASARLTEEFKMNIPHSPVPVSADGTEPEPMGRFRTLYFDGNLYGVGDYRVGVTFHAGWPIELLDTRAEVLVYGRQGRPIVAHRRMGQGTFVLIGDSGFALNKNLEYIGGESFDGKRENADFWRWLISRVTNREEWIPAPPAGDSAREGSEVPRSSEELR